MKISLMLLGTLFAFGSIVAMQSLEKKEIAKGLSNDCSKFKTKAIGAAKTLIPREVLLAKPDRIAVKINHDGNKISYISRNGKQVELVVANLDGSVVRKFDVRAARELSQYVWSRNGNFIFILQDTNGDENNHIIALDICNGSRKDLTPFANVRAEFVCQNQQNQDELIINCNKRNPQWMDTYKVNVVTGELELLFENNKYSQILFDEQLQTRIATETAADGGTNIYKFEGDRAIFWKHVSFEDSHNSAFIIQDRIIGNEWYYLSSEGQDKNVLIKHDLKSGSSEKLFTYSKADIQSVIFDKRMVRPLVVESEYLVPELFALSSDVRDNLKFLKDKFGESTINITSINWYGTKWIVAISSPTEMPRYYVYDTKKKELKFLFHAQEQLRKYPLQEMHPVVVKSRDGLDLVCYLTKAIGASSKLIMYIHGGPWCRDSYKFNKVVQFLANRGYSVLQVNYRGSLGFGKKFSSAINMNLDKVQNDIIDAANWAVKKGIAKRDQIGIMGGSFGGYSVLAGLAFTPDFFCCGVDVVGPSNWITLFSKVPEYWKPYMISWYKCVGDPGTKEGRKILEKNSPLSKAHRIIKPLIIFQGERDPRVNKNESEMIVTEMKKRNIPVSYVLYPDEGHGFVREPNQISYLALVEKFLADVFGGWYEPIGKNELNGSSHKIMEMVEK